MTPIAEIPLPPDAGRFTSIDFSADGDAVLIGTNALEGAAHTLGVLWVDWAASPVTSRARAVPKSSMPVALDAGAAPIDVDGDRVVVVASTASLYGAPHEQIWLLSRTGRVGPTLLCDVPGAAAVLFLSGSRRELLMSNGATLEHLRLDPGDRQVLDVEVDRAVRKVALHPAGKHVALATRDTVTCEAIGGTRLGTWHTPADLLGLRFADDDLGLWGVTREAVLHFPIGGGVVPWTVPGQRPIAAHGRVALFGSPDGLTTLDLSSGATAGVGTIDVPVHGYCWAAARRQIATLTAAEATQTLRVFQY